MKENEKKRNSRNTLGIQQSTTRFILIWNFNGRKNRRRQGFFGGRMFVFPSLFLRERERERSSRSRFSESKRDHHTASAALSASPSTEREGKEAQVLPAFRLHFVSRYSSICFSRFYFQKSKRK
ncbi:hypothetical protein GBA52_028518 [Prunus armeniaca]|nr:hypothetical protein GBA52_028518 [Prunus armeniaca]